MNTYQAKQLAENALNALIEALEKGRSEALRTYLAAIGRFHRVLVWELPSHCQPEARRNPRCGIPRLAEAPPLCSQG